nr:hypothetical protein GCM10025730_47520 [Promicromonospora thailandica]
MELRQMEYLVALAEERQFTRAAELTGVSQSGLSAAIRNLEVELGTRLFTRTTRRVEPTEAGLALLPFARSMLSSATEARDAVVQVSRELAGTLRVGAEQCLGLVDVASLLERFHRRYPRVEIAFSQAGSHELLAEVRDGGLDVAFVATADHVGVLPRTVLGQEPVVLLCPPDHPSPPGRSWTGATWAVRASSTSTRRGRCAGSTTTRSRPAACTAGCGSRSTRCTPCWTSSTAASVSRSCPATSRPSRRPPAS